MRRHSLKNVAYGFALAIVVMMVDQWSKMQVMGAGLAQHPIEALPFLNFVYVLNRGVSFGMFNNENPLPPGILAALALAIAAGFAVWLTKVSSGLAVFAIGLVIGGAAGNVVDRMTVGAVIDFIDFHVNDWHWPAFNIADSAIVVGIALILLDGLWLGRKAEKRL